jgi:hypothetical protein
LERVIQKDSLVHGIDLSPDGRTLVLGAGRRVEVIPTERQQAPTVLPSHEAISRATEVVFATELPYRWRITSDNKQEFAFDGQLMNWMETGQTTWNSTSSLADGFAQDAWRLSTQVNAPGVQNEDWIMRGNQRVAKLDLTNHYRLKPGSHITHLTWVKTETGDLAGVAIALSQQNDIWYFSLPATGETTCSLERVYRGHEGAISSIDTSPDGRYLISCSDDSTIRVWPTSGLFLAQKEHLLRKTWGFDFRVAESRLIAQDPIYSGPLYIKGLRPGDQLKEISYETYIEGGKLQRTTIVQPDEMLALLAEPRFDLALRFIFERGGVAVPGFQSYPHWRELAAQVVADNREWAIWTPSGFYDASFNGNSMFGWQINLGIDKEPAFYRADRFQNVLERPDLMRRLLTSGSIEHAAEQIGQRPIGFGSMLQNSIALAPQETILSPASFAAGTAARQRQGVCQRRCCQQDGRSAARDFDGRQSTHRIAVAGSFAVGQRTPVSSDLLDARETRWH